MRKELPVLTAALILAGSLGGCMNESDDGGNHHGFPSINGDVTADQSGASTVNGSINVPAGEHTANLNTVNGSISVADNAVAGMAHTVNGSIRFGQHSTADSAVTVNGSINMDPGAHVSGGLKTVNGGMRLQRADVGGGVSNVNGAIELDAAHVSGGISTVEGDIDVLGASRVEGGILVHRRNDGFFSFGWSSHHTPRVVIGPGATVDGTLRFEQQVHLYVSDKATIGPVSGATPIKFAGDNPPG